MTMPLTMGNIIKISRFRFWIYTGGTFVVGYALGMESWLAFFRPEYYLYLLYFFILVNIFIYGVNDYWDAETDRLNPKKDLKEHKVQETERRDLSIVLLSVGAFSGTLLLFETTEERLILLAFLFLAYFYSAPPLRFKAIPFLDFAANMLYVMPGIFGYYLAGGAYPPLLFVLGGFFHIAAMHLFSAIPDIDFDRNAGITTTAVFLGKRASLVLCTIFWLFLSAIVLALSGYYPLSVLVLILPLIPMALLAFPRLQIEEIYWYLPYINTALGGLLFTAVTFMKIAPLP